MKKDFRYLIKGFDMDSWDKIVNQCWKEGKEVECLPGVLVDNYLMEDIRLKWGDYNGVHNVHFDYLVVLEQATYDKYTQLVGYGIKERGMTEEERKLLEDFRKDLDKYYDEEEEAYFEEERKAELVG